jgi:hypothetical protein
MAVEKNYIYKWTIVEKWKKLMKIFNKTDLEKTKRVTNYLLQIFGVKFEVKNTFNWRLHLTNTSLMMLFVDRSMVSGFLNGKDTV